MAAGVVFAARERGIGVPEELSIIGFDDTPIAGHIWPPLTTVRWPIVSMARAAALKLLTSEADSEADVAEPSLFLSRLVKRGSVAAPCR
jgi:LacI family transcriptional regulator